MGNRDSVGHVHHVGHHRRSSIKNAFKRRASTAATSQSLELTQTAGPWLIMCASFNGEQGLQQAIQLSNELRNDHG